MEAENVRLQDYIGVMSAKTKRMHEVEEAATDIEISVASLHDDRPKRGSGMQWITVAL